MPWNSRFAEPIELPDGTRLVSLKEAVAHLAKTVPKGELKMQAVLTAAEMLTMAAEGERPMEFARIATLQAIHRHHVRSFDPGRKSTHWSRPKLKRDR